MIDFISSIIPYISGLYTIPWIVVGFLATIVLSRIYTQSRINLTMKNISLILLYFFVPALVFRIFLDTHIGIQEGIFAIVVAVTILLMYLIAFIYAIIFVKKNNMVGVNKTIFLKTMITNQGRSSAFVGGIMLTIPGWGVPAGIFMAIAGIELFAVVPYILAKINTIEKKGDSSVLPLPWFLKFYPWYFIVFPIAGFLLQKTTGFSTASMGTFGVLFKFYTALTTPIALYYVGSGIHPKDMKISELKKLIGIDKEDVSEHWSWVRHIFIMATLVTPAIIATIFFIMLQIQSINIPPEWFAVCVVNSLLPITSTTMFLIPYGIDKRTTALSVTWSTMICVPVVIVLIPILAVIFSH